MRDKPRFNKPGQVRRAAPGSQSGTEVIYGRNAVMETLHKSTRTIHEILVLPQHKDELLEASGGIPVRVLPRPDLDRITSTSHHQGMAARVTPYAYAELKDLYAKRCVLLLDSVEDPQNLGAIIRSAYALADAGVIIPEHRSARSPRLW
jgi:23S rRNA (guanosine2251-2'-O)-methyltransferase